MIRRAAKWVAFQLDTYRVAHEEGMSYWQLRRLRKAARQFVDRYMNDEKNNPEGDHHP